ncbi:hypothetical protein GGQ85_003999 [Nitrobacter vulgaris]|nr:hypothetical protein [Nitrobacter vulgaris]
MFIHHASRVFLAFPLGRTSFERSKSGRFLIAIIAADSVLAVGAWYAAASQSEIRCALAGLRPHERVAILLKLLGQVELVEVAIERWQGSDDRFRTCQLLDWSYNAIGTRERASRAQD